MYLLGTYPVLSELFTLGLITFLMISKSSCNAKFVQLVDDKFYDAKAKMECKNTDIFVKNVPFLYKCARPCQLRCLTC